jgi:hypothetical protein
MGKVQSSLFFAINKASACFPSITSKLHVSLPLGTVGKLDDLAGDF